MRSNIPRCATVLTLMVATIVARQSAAAPCNSLPNPVFIEAGDTQMLLLNALGRQLRDERVPMTLVFYPRSTCTLTENFYRGKSTTENMRFVPSQGESRTCAPGEDPATAKCWALGTFATCENDATGTPIDLGIGATFISSCAPGIQSLRPADVSLFRGPVQAYGFVVPEGTLARVQGITREEAYFVFAGQGQQAGASPWVDDPLETLFIRGVTTSTLLTLAANVAPELLPAADWAGYRKTGQDDRSSVVIDGLVAARGKPNQDAHIGLLGVELYDSNRQKLDLLAYQAAGQRYGYYPDSTPEAQDKRNVRDGLYVPWGYTEYLARVDSAGKPVLANAQRVLDLVTGDTPIRLRSAEGVASAFDIDALEVVAARGLIPTCAMNVSRQADGGELSLTTPAAPCGCFYETAQNPSLRTNPPVEWTLQCKVCSGDAECGTGVCRRGYCEVR